MRISASGIMLGLLAAMPVGVNVWKFAVRSYTLYEIWPHVLLDVSILLLFFMLLAKNPLEIPAVYGSAFAFFCVAYITANTPSSILEWAATGLVLTFFGLYLFPVFLSRLPWILLGLLLSYYGILRMYLPELNRTEVMTILAAKSAPETAREFVRTLTGYERNVIGREKYRYFLDSENGYVERLKDAGKLHAAVVPEMAKVGIAFLEWSDARPQTRGTDVVFPSAVLNCVMEASDENGRRLARRARVQEFHVALRRLDDGSFRVSSFPESVKIELLPDGSARY